MTASSTTPLPPPFAPGHHPAAVRRALRAPPAAVRHHRAGGRLGGRRGVDTRGAAAALWGPKVQGGRGGCGPVEMWEGVWSGLGAGRGWGLCVEKWGAVDRSAASSQRTHATVQPPSQPAQVGSDDDGYAVRLRFEHFLRYITDPDHSKVRMVWSVTVSCRSFHATCSACTRPGVQPPLQPTHSPTNTHQPTDQPILAPPHLQIHRTTPPCTSSTAPLPTPPAPARPWGGTTPYRSSSAKTCSNSRGSGGGRHTDGSSSAPPAAAADCISILSPLTRGTPCCRGTSGGRCSRRELSSRWEVWGVRS
jgi:hypothetical protein